MPDVPADFTRICPDRPESEVVDEREPWMDAAEWVEYHFTMLAQANTPALFSARFTALSNAVADLRTYLDGYDYESNTMPWQRVDV